MISSEQLQLLSNAIHSDELAQQLLKDIEQLLRVVFHNLDEADWSRAKQAAEQILMTELVNRHKGDIVGIHDVIEAKERQNETRMSAIQNYASSIHSYYTTPIGITARKAIFGDRSVFLSPIALDWASHQSGQPSSKTKTTEHA